jgi:tetratricopeptide (TPR) repeat protein
VSYFRLCARNSRNNRALECVEQACGIAPEDRELIDLRDAVKAAAKRAKTLEEALRRGQAALYSGDLKEAEAAVNEALQCDRNHTEARALDEQVKKEIAERSRRQQVHGFVEQAREEISRNQFLAALRALQQAREIDPGDSNIQELFRWATRGHEQEKRRHDLDAFTKEISNHLAGEDYISASKICDSALRTFPEEPSLIKLKQLADRQGLLAERRRFVEEQSVQTRHLSDSGSYEEAIAVLQSALRRYPDEESFVVLLGMIRNELEFRQRAKLDAERIDSELDSKNSSKLQQTQSLAEIRQFEGSLHKARSSSEVAALVERSGFFARQHAIDPQIQTVYQQILNLAAKFREKMDAALSEASQLEESMRSCRDVPRLEEIHSRISAIQTEWPEEKQLCNVFDRASERLYASIEAKNVIQAELAHLQQSITSARSLTQISLYVQQAKILSIEWASDRDVEKKLALLQSEAQKIIGRVEASCAQIKSLTSKLLNSPTMKESEKEFASAKATAQEVEVFEEIQELLEKAHRRLVERKNDYQRIERGIGALIDSTANVRGPAELELILARRRDLIGKYPHDQYFASVVNDLETALASRRAELVKQAAIEDAEEKEANANPVDATDAPVLTSTGPDVISSRHTGAARPQLSHIPRKLNPLLFKATGLLLSFFVASGTALFYFSPRSIEILTAPTGAITNVDGVSCVQPCVAHLKPGSHIVTGTLENYEEYRQSFNVSHLNNAPWIVALKPTPPETRQAMPSLTPVAPNSTKTASISIQTIPAIPQAEVLLDNSPIALTDSAGKAVLQAALGQHSVQVNKAAYRPVPAKTVTLSQDRPASLKFQLEREPSFDAKIQPIPPKDAPIAPSNTPSITLSPALPDTFIVLQAPTGAEIHIDQQFAGHSTGGPIKTRVQPGQRTIEVFLLGFQTWTQTLSIDAGKEVAVVAKLAPVPVPAVPSAPIAAHPTSSGPADEDRRQIQQVLDIYRSGFNQRDLRLLQRAYPRMPKELLDTYKQFFKNKSVSMKLQISSMDMVGSQIKVEAVQTVGYQDENGKMQETPPSKVTLLFTNPGGQWIIAAIPVS